MLKIGRKHCIIGTIKKLFIYFCFIYISVFFAQCTISQEEEGDILSHYTISNSGKEVRNINAKITVELNKPYIAPYSHSNGLISPHLYGTNWANWFKFSSSLVEKAAPLHLRVIRLGGSQMSRYNWRSGKFTFPGNENVRLQATAIDEFIRACRQLGAEPLIQINALGWAPNDKNNDIFERCMTARDAADLVTYLNGTKGYNIKYFEIDNEPFYWHETHKDIWGEEMTIEKYTEIFKDYAYAMKKAQAQISNASDIKIFGPAISKSWEFTTVPYFLRECRKFERDRLNNPEGYRILDVLSFHYYPLYRTDWRKPKSFIPEGVPAMLESTQTWWNPTYINEYDRNQSRGEPTSTIPRFSRYIEECYPGTELAITEVSVDSQIYIKYDPVVKPIYIADLCGIMAKYGIDYAMLQFIPHDDPGHGLISVSRKTRSTYYPLMLYSQHFNGKLLTADSNKSDLLNVYACDDGKGCIVLMVVNKDDKPYDAAINLIGYNGTAVKDKFHLNFEKYSLTCIKIPKYGEREFADIWVYGEEQIEK